MTDFAKEARDLRRRSDAPNRPIMYRLVDDIEDLARRMHAEGFAEGMAKAAEIARGKKRKRSTPALRGDGWLVNSVCDEIAEAILAASPHP